MTCIIEGEYNSTPPTITDSRTHPLQVDVNGNLKVVTSASRSADAFQSTMTSADAQFAKQVKALTASKSIYITDVVISVGTAMSVQLEDSAATVIMEQVYLAANSVFSKSFTTPLKLGSGVGLNAVASTAGNVSVTVSGYVL